MSDSRETQQQLWLKHAKGAGIEKPTMTLLFQLVTAWGARHRHHRPGIATMNSRCITKLRMLEVALDPFG
jgi:hypothetical protein